MSLKLRVLNAFLRIAIKRPLAHLQDPIAARTGMERTSKWLFRAPAGTKTERVRIDANCDALWVEAKANVTTDARPVLYFHGGGYVVGSPRTHLQMLGRLARLTGRRIFVPSYRKAPEHPFPAAFDDAISAFDYLVKQGHSASDIIIGGDSAGGGLALALLAHLNANGVCPRAVFAFSPFTDAAFSGASFVENAQSDPLLLASRKDIIADWYLQGSAPLDPRISPLYASFSGPLPPIFLQYSATEILRDDSVRIGQKLAEAGAEVQHDMWKDTPHVWVYFARFLPEARDALRRVATFLEARG